MQVLPYEIPPFKTVAWVSDEARAIWIPRFEVINNALIDVLIEGIHKRIFKHQYCIVEGYLYFELLEKAEVHNISVEATFLGDENIKGPIYYEVFLVSRDTDLDTIPSHCCGECNAAIQKAKRKEHIWEAAQLSAHTKEENFQITLPAGSDTSVFWQRFLVTIGNQHRCRFDCDEFHKTQQIALNLLKESGHQEAYKWLRQIYSWPVAWNASHGICELRTPIVKLAYDTDATASSYVVHVEGSTYPEEGAPGNRFPYRQRKFLRITDSKSFKRGLEHGCK